MKVLLVNKFLYPRGGAETYTFALGKILEKHGHQVQYFGMESPKNIVGNQDNSLVSEMDFSKGVLKNLNAPFRMIYSVQARKKIRVILDDFQPDVVHLNNIEYHLTPSIILEINKWRTETKHKCKIVYTAHDYQLVCPSHGLFDKDLRPCELCLDGKYRHCFETKCLKGSRMKSLLGTIDGYYWKNSPVYSYVDTFICCSNFLKEKLDTQERFRSKTIAIHNFKDITKLDDVQKQNYVLQFGHLSKDKGTDTVLEAAKQLPQYKFVFAGYGPSVEKMKGIPNVEYVGFKTGEELYRLVASALCTIQASEMYENCPFSVIESISYGTPVVGSRMGGIPELINVGVDGELYEAGNVTELKDSILKIIGSEDNLKKYTAGCANAKFETSESYYKKLLSIYS